MLERTAIHLTTVKKKRQDSLLFSPPKKLLGISTIQHIYSHNSYSYTRCIRITFTTLLINKTVWKDAGTLWIICEKSSQSLFWTLHTFNMGTICHTYNVQEIFKLHPRMLQQINVNCCNSGLNSVLKITDVSHWNLVLWCTILLEEHSTLQSLYLWTDKVLQHIQVTVGCHRGFGKEKGADQIITQQTTPHINFGAVSNVLHCSISMFWSPDVYILFVYLPSNVECSLVREQDFLQISIVFVVSQA
jgi:hypothetical protein